MTEHQPSPERTGQPIKPRLSVEQLAITERDPDILALWQEGLDRWGDAFAAYTTLGEPELDTPDVLTAFQKRHHRSYNNIEAAIQDHLYTYGWSSALTHFKREQSLDADMLVWDQAAVMRQLENDYQLVRTGDKIHAFWK